MLPLHASATAPTPIDLETWPRRDHFRLFKGMDHPYFSLTVDLDVTAAHARAKAAALPFFPLMVHRVTAAAHAVEALRLRIRGEGVVRHDRVQPSFTVPWRDTLFNFCTVDFEPDAAAFVARAVTAIAEASAAPHLLLDEPQRDDMVFMSCAPWFTFTALTHPVDGRSGDSIPRLSWGKLTERDGRLWVPFNLQLHHALCDGLHVAQFLEAFASGD